LLSADFPCEAQQRSCHLIRARVRRLICARRPPIGAPRKLVPIEKCRQAQLGSIAKLIGSPANSATRPASSAERITETSCPDSADIPSGLSTRRAIVTFSTTTSEPPSGREENRRILCPGCS